MAERTSREQAKQRILSTCVKLFIQKGYNDTTVAEILKGAHVSNSTFQNIFGAKDGVLTELVDFMFSSQFEAARSFKAENYKPVYVYALETAIQLTLTELNENLRDIYIEVYSEPMTAERVFRATAAELLHIFGDYNPDFSESDFYEMDIGTSGIMRNYMAKSCDPYFTLERKIERFLRMAMKIYNVPEEEWEDVLSFVFNIDIRKTANGIMQKLFQSLAMHFNFEL